MPLGLSHPLLGNVYNAAGGGSPPAAGGSAAWAQSLDRQAAVAFVRGVRVFTNVDPGQAPEDR